MQQMLFEDITIDAGESARLVPWSGIEVGRYDRLHFHIARLNRGVGDLKVDVLFGTPIGDFRLMVGSVVWFEDTTSLRHFSYTTPADYGKTGFAMSTPVIAPELHDVLVYNLGKEAIDGLYVSVMSQEI